VEVENSFSLTAFLVAEVLKVIATCCWAQQGHLATVSLAVLACIHGAPGGPTASASAAPNPVAVICSADRISPITFYPSSFANVAFLGTLVRVTCSPPEMVTSLEMSSHKRLLPGH